MEFQAKFTNKYLNFINERDLREILLQRLNELDGALLVNSNLAVIVLSIGTLEGILKYVSKIFRTEIRRSTNYPRYTTGTWSGRPKGFDKLTIDDMYILLKELGILSDINNFKEVYNLFRDYRNFIHPQAQQRKQWPVSLGQAQMAIGLLNATINQLNNLLFINENIFERKAGQPDYIDNVILLNKDKRTRWNSLFIHRKPVSRSINISFDIELSEKAILNFIFDYSDLGNFKMIRLDGRRDQRFVNSVLCSTQPQHWTIKLLASEIHPPEKDNFHVEIRINFRSSDFNFLVDGNAYSFTSLDGTPKTLFDEIHPNLRIGFFNEVNTVKLTNLRIT